MNFIYYLRDHLRLHPSAQPRDVVKLCYQSAFGAEHLLLDIATAKEYFDDEFSSVSENEDALFEQISSEYCRINLAAWKSAGLPGEWLFNMFRITASSSVVADADAMFSGCLQDVESMVAHGEAPFTEEDWHVFMDGYDAFSPKPVHHSEEYRKSERPAYRVVSMQYARLIPLLKLIDKVPEHPGIIAIDGRSASGKTTLANALEEIIDAGVIHMDDFFLPGDLRTDARLASPGGNVHYERFLSEVLPCLSSGNAFSYRAFDCEEMRLGDIRHVRESKWRVVEGAYSCHPEFSDYMGLRVFCDTAPDEQLRRIARRNGEEMADVFKSRWIPMEELYFKACSISEKADISLG